MKKKRKGYKPLPVSKKNTSGKPSKAKREAEKRKKKPKTGMNKKASKPKKVFSSKKPYSYRLSALNPKTPKQLPETEISKKGMTLRKLLRSTPRLMMNNSVDVEALEFKRTKTRSGLPAIKAITITNDPYRKDKVIRKHKTFIIGAETDDDNNPVDKPINKHKKVICSCDCESWVFTFENAVAEHGASRIVYGNGEPPVVTNPSLAPGLCKHLVAVATKLIKSNK
jgi:hypothetical protein